jgi:peptide/nickel transport system permease protein
VTRRAVSLAAVFAALALVAPWVAPYDAGRAFRDFLHAPPMRPHLAGFGAPMAHPLVLVDRLEQRYQADTSRIVPLPWLAPRAADEAPVFLLGADSFGRDVFSRLCHGARVSVGLALVATFGAVLVGALAGAWAGFRGGWVDESIMRVADFILVLPVIYVALVLRSMLPLSLPGSTVFLLMAWIFVAVSWPFVARGVRAIVSSERQREYVLAARALGAGPARVLARHLIPACAGYLVVQATLLLPAFILAEATLSFVGLGFPEDLPTWGTMLVEAANVTQAARFPWVLAPAAAIFAVVFTTNLVLMENKGTRR